MNAIRQIYNELPEMIKIPAELVHSKAEIIILTEKSNSENKKSLLDFFGSIPDFPDRFPQGKFEERSQL